MEEMANKRMAAEKKRMMAEKEKMAAEDKAITE